VALNKLDAESRAAFVLRHVEGCDLGETATACNCSLATIKRRLAKAEKRFEAISRADPVLRTFLQERGEP
jgi:RNA polymerase sigma-70 factor (ECF subfamily)